MSGVVRIPRPQHPVGQPTSATIAAPTRAPPATPVTPDSRSLHLSGEISADKCRSPRPAGETDKATTR